MLTLTSLNGQEKGREFQLTGESPELLGRQAPKLQLADAQTSRKHAEILLENNTWLIRDLDSTNGTWVNGQKIAQITELEVGDRIVIGRHQFRVSGISDLPSPSPKPVPVPSAPLIDDEELGEMGVDLSESLSADILDDAEALPDSAIDDDDASPADAQASAPPLAGVQDEPDDGVIDLDALLDESLPEGEGHDSSISADAPAQDAPAEAASPTVADDDGVIDLDALLNDGPDSDAGDVSQAEASALDEPEAPEAPAVGEPDDAPKAEELTPAEESPKTEDPTPAEEAPAIELPSDDADPAENELELPDVLDTPATAEAASGEVDFDLDELLEGELDEPAADKAADSGVALVDEPDEFEPAEQSDVALDLDASDIETAEPDTPIVIPDDEPQAEAPPLEEPTDQPVSEGDSAPTDEPDADIPPPPAPDDEASSDSIEDLDAMLEGLVDEPADPPEDDVIASAPTPEPDAPSLPEGPSDEQGVRDSDAQESAEDAVPQAESDDLIDIDILAAASPAVGLPGGEAQQDEAQEDATEGSQIPAEAPTAADEGADHGDVLEESGMFADDSGIMDAGDTGADLDDAIGSGLDDSFGALQDSGKSSGLGEAGLVDEADAETTELTESANGPAAQDLGDEPELQETERELLLSEEEQSKAVTGYKRSKLVTLLLVVLISAAVGFGGWYGYQYVAQRSADGNAPNAQRPEANEPAITDAVVDDPENETADNPTGQSAGPANTREVAPKRPTGYVGIPDIPRRTPEKTPDADIAEEPEGLENPLAPGEPIPPANSPSGLTDDPAEGATSDTPTNDRSLAPDAFEDVEASVFDTPDPEPTREAPTPPADTEATPEPVSQADPADSMMLADERIALPTDTTTSPQVVQAGSAEPAEPETVANNGSPTADVEPIPVVTAEEDTSSKDTAGADPAETQLDVLAEVIDANNKPGVGVNEEAALAGAMRIVYLVDASGSLVDSFPRVLNELTLSIDGLNEDQAFTAIFFGAEGVTELPPTGLKWADAQTKRNAQQWIDPDRGNVTAWGRGDVMAAVKRATEYGADEIVVLSDNLLGRRPSQEKIDALLDEIATLTDGKVAKINVIQFFTRDPKQVLKTIAERFNGTYSLVPAISEPSAEVTGDEPVIFP